MRNLIAIIAMLAAIAFHGISSASNLGTTDPFVETCMGLRGNDFCVVKFGYNDDLDAAQEVISRFADYWQPTSASALEFLSDSALDTPVAGTGCRKMCAEGLDASFNVVTECEDMLGVAASSSTTATFIRMYRAWCSEMGTYGDSNSGNITVRISGAGAQVGDIEEGMGQTTIGAYTVPAGFSCNIVSVDFGSDEASAGVEGMIFALPNVNDVTSPYGGSKRLQLRTADVQSGGNLYPGMPIKLDEYTDVWCAAESGSNSDVSCVFRMVCMEN